MVNVVFPSRSTNVIGLQAPLRSGVDVHVIMQIVTGIVTQARKRGYDILLLTSDDSKALVAAAIGLLISGLAVARVVPVAEGLLIGTIVFAGGVAFTMPAIMAMAVVGVAPDERGAVVGTAGLFVDAAFGLSPAVLGLLATAVDYPATFLVSAVIAAIGAAYLLLWRPGAARSARAPSAST